MVEIALISDTHVPDQIRQLPSRLVERLRDADLILHAGDLVCLEVLKSLQGIARTIAVHGNMDEPVVRRHLPRRRLLTLAGKRVGLIHGNQPPGLERQYLRPEYNYDSEPVAALYEYLLREFPEAEIILFGHVHVPIAKHWEGRLLVNPGSIAPYHGRSSFAILKLEDSEAAVDVIDL
jgi:putative phosphoesterase